MIHCTIINESQAISNVFCVSFTDNVQVFVEDPFWLLPVSEDSSAVECLEGERFEHNIGKRILNMKRRLSVIKQSTMSYIA